MKLNLIVLIILLGTLCLVDLINSERFVPRWKKQACEKDRVQKQYSKQFYTCDDNGDVTCMTGWTGDLCDVPICKRGCDPMTGYCRRPGECRCKLGFYGEKCDRCIPLPGCQHGTCTQAFECRCKPGWDGLFCSEPICRDECHPSRGYCEAPGECRCRLGWAGSLCRECQVLPGCMHGTCSQPLECKCLPGWRGVLCQIPMCSETCHKRYGYCTKPNDCRCKVGWTGENCDVCVPYPGCKNGSCRRPWECNCLPGWGSHLCDEKLDYCELNPDTCQNGGKCMSFEREEGSFRCECPTGYKGRRCDIVPQTISLNMTIETDTDQTTTESDMETTTLLPETETKCSSENNATRCDTENTTSEIPSTMEDIKSESPLTINVTTSASTVETGISNPTIKVTSDSPIDTTTSSPAPTSSSSASTTTAPVINSTTSIKKGIRNGVRLNGKNKPKKNFKEVDNILKSATIVDFYENEA